MSVLKKIFLGLIVLVILVAGAAVIAVKTIDINQYREQIATQISQQIGRTVKFEGPIHLAFNEHGVGLEVEKASIGNPNWASRPQMASIGKLNLGVALMPLLQRTFVITEFDIKDADIQLETGANDQHNWDLKPVAGTEPTPAPSPAPAAKGSPQAAMPVGVLINELSIVNSQVAMRDKDGKVSTFKVTKLTLSPEGRSTTITLNADYNGSPIKLAIKASTSNLMTLGRWPYDADLTYANYHLHAQGSADTQDKTIELNPYEFNVGGTALHGQLMANFGGSRGEMRGTIMGEKLDTADLKSQADAAAAPGAPSGSKESAPAGKRLFSDQPIDFSALKSANANIDISIGEIVVGKTSLKQTSGRLTLANGNLTITPLKASLGGSSIEGDIKLTAASSPAQYSMSFKAPGVDMASLLQLGGAEAFLAGKADTDIQLSGSGNSLHDMASSTDGHINVIAAGGTISGSAASGIAASLAQIFAPGTSNPALNCLAARFNVNNGVAKDNGILADSTASTVAGAGGFDLGKEIVDLSLNAKPKIVNTRGLVPAVLISGPLGSPQIGINATGVAENVVGMLLKKGDVGAASSTVPAIQPAPDGQNACIYTLEHKPAAAADTGASKQGVKDVLGKATNGKVQDIGNKLMQGILGGH